MEYTIMVSDTLFSNLFKSILPPHVCISNTFLCETYMAIFICCCGSCRYADKYDVNLYVVMFLSYVYLNYIAEPLYAKIHEWMTVEEKVIHASIYDDPETQPDAQFVVAH